MIWSYYSKYIASLDSLYEEELNMIIDWIEDNDLNSVSSGRHDIDGDHVYVNVLNYDTKDEAECVWEAHRKYLDLHYIINGQEMIALSHISNMHVGEYEDESDYVHVIGDTDSKIFIKHGSVILLYPDDVHKTAISGFCSSKIKKCVFKIKIHKQS